MKITTQNLPEIVALLSKEISAGQRWACPIAKHLIPEKGIAYVLYEDNSNRNRKFIIRVKVSPGRSSSWVVTSSSENTGFDTFGCPDDILNGSTMTSPSATDWRRRCHQSNLRKMKKEQSA